MKERIDRILVKKGLAPTRQKAQALIMAGLVYAGGKQVKKAGELIESQSDLRIKNELPYVSRGGLKLAEALDAFRIDVSEATVVDIGCSTGGFTDCLLQRGAEKVFAVDVDTKQIDFSLRKDPRVVLIEKNARYLTARDVNDEIDLITVDVSFISITKIFPALTSLPGKWLLLVLVKPQFEAGRRDVGRRGVVKDADIHKRVLKKVIETAALSGFSLKGLLKCSTKGQKGNVEFFALWDRLSPPPMGEKIAAWIEEVVTNGRH